MDPENQSANSRPTGTSKLPGITLVVLIGLIIALLYVGYEGIADNTKGSEELTNVPLDTTDRQAGTLESEPELIGPEDVDTSTAPVPVDLSQAEAPPDESVADASAASTAKPPTSAVETTTSKPAADDKPPVDKPKVDKPKVEKPVADKPKAEKPKVEKPVEKPVEEKPKAEPVATQPAETEAEVIKPAVSAGGVETRHTVGAGETFYSIANRYNLKINTLKALNPGVTETSVKSGVTKLNLKVRAVHTVGPGDVLRVVAQKYGVTVDALMRANKKDKNIATRGEKLIIPFPEKQ